MKNIFLILLLFAAVAVNAQTTEGTTITVSIDNVPDGQGKVIVSLFNQDTFMKAPPIQSESSSIKDGKISVSFTGVAPGEYGVISFHDRNDNGKIDMNSTGIPTEAYGVSNNPMSFGPPQWSEAKFEVTGEPVELKIRY
ncbi:MAG: DUF2141 domain-containing protein [Salinimicrobium sp.]